MHQYTYSIYSNLTISYKSNLSNKSDNSDDSTETSDDSESESESDIFDKLVNFNDFIPNIFHSPHLKRNIFLDSTIRDNSNLGEKSHNNIIGKTSNLTKETPFISFLIDKRIKFCHLGASSHIAAFIPTSINLTTLFSQFGNSNAIIGENSNKPLYSNTKIKTHAEMEALEKAKGLLRCKRIKKNKMNLIVIRINKMGELCESAPCFHCTKKLCENNFIQISKLYYSRHDGSITCVKFDDWARDGNHSVSKGWKWLEKNNKFK